VKRKFINNKLLYRTPKYIIDFVVMVILQPSLLSDQAVFLSSSCLEINACHSWSFTVHSLLVCRPNQNQSDQDWILVVLHQWLSTHLTSPGAQLIPTFFAWGKPGLGHGTASRGRGPVVGSRRPGLGVARLATASWFPGATGGPLALHYLLLRRDLVPLCLPGFALHLVQCHKSAIEKVMLYTNVSLLETWIKVVSSELIIVMILLLPFVSQIIPYFWDTVTCKFPLWKVITLIWMNLFSCHVM
jgi:hypothetical protein